MEPYQKSARHLANLHKGSLIGAQKQKEERRKRVELYYINPKRCLKCDGAISYEKKKVNRFCSSSCSASYTQYGSKKSQETKNKISKSLIGTPCKYKGLTNNEYINPRTKKCAIRYRTCNHCKQLFVSANAKNNYDRRTCSHICHIQASVGTRTYQNGKRKVIWFDNPWQGRVLLESSWELEIANLLGEHNIKWFRPMPIVWIDVEGKTRHYFPDFYLPNQNMYLDPKNPYCMIRDKNKMAAVEKLIPIIYGHKDAVMEYINRIPL